ncbi:hypothetical protein Clacol_000345 [Clathrus columnatus]|uniref:Uncharacterized protein n=1 Tax=Clathrus columnatus TaxID=1419009 RepID=A0AAV5A0P9_9AGAM|nr:hypothetical protein Clacol_000345 [Clathrus columnatus]
MASRPPMEERGSALYEQMEGHGSDTALATTAAVPAGWDVGDVGAPNTPGAPPTPKKTPFWKKKKFLIAQAIIWPLVIVLIFVFLFPVVRAIAQLIINRSQLDVTSATISNPTNNSAHLPFSQATHTGIFDAEIQFKNNLTVSWTDTSGQSHQLGDMVNFPPLFAKAKTKRATLNHTVDFVITDTTAFGEFTATMITQPNFTWELSCPSLQVNADKFPAAKGLHFNKQLTLNGGCHVLNDPRALLRFDADVVHNKVALLNFALPADAPDNAGILFSATTGLNNSSPFDIDLGDVVFNLSYNGVFLGEGTGTNTVISPGENSITLNGTLIHQESSNLQSVSQLFTNYINSEPGTFVTAQGVSTKQSDGSEIAWLSQGLKSLKLQVPFKPPTAINPIRGIGIDFLNLSFSSESPWAPLASSNQVQAQLQLPFGFHLEITQIQNSFAIFQNNSIISNLSTPEGASTSSIQVLSPNDTQGTINITLSQSPLDVPSDAHDRFSTFILTHLAAKELTDSKTTTFQLIGQSSAVSNLSIGLITLNPIKFNVNSSLNGLQGLQKDVVINTVDVTGGTSDHIELSIGDLQLVRDGAVMGTTTIPNLVLNMGNNTLPATAAFRPNNNQPGQQTLNDFVGGTDVVLSISGFNNSTNIPSLLSAFESLNISTTLPALKTSLLKTASLVVLPSTGHANDIANVKVDLANPFSGDLTITNINSTVTSHGLMLGTIGTATNFNAQGNSTTTSPTLPLVMNLNPPDIFGLLRALATEAGESTQQLDGILQVGGITPAATTNEDSPSQKRELQERDNIFTGFDLPTFVDKAFQGLKTDINLQTQLSIGGYATSLEFMQKDVPVETDSTLNLLLPVLAQPIVQKVIDASVLGISTVIITNPQQNSFETILVGNISNAGPFDAEINFNAGLSISFNGQTLGTLQMPNVQVIGDVGAQLNVSATFNIADVDRLTNFTRVLLTEEQFVWDISAENLTVSALGIDVPGVSLLTKSVTLKGMNGLQNGVTIDTFDLPSNDPAGGIHLTLQTTVKNPSQVGIDLSSIGFNNFVGTTMLGPATSTSSFTLAPLSTINLPLVGRLIPQTSQSGLDALSAVFTNFIHGIPSNVSVVGASAGPSDVTWLNDAISSLKVSTILPDRGKLQVIENITLEKLELDFTSDTAFNPSTSSSLTTAAFTIPFDFPIDIVALEQNITTSLQSTGFAELDIPLGNTTTDVNSRIITLAFSDVPFAVFSNEHAAFENFLAQTTVSTSETFELSGAANAHAQTAAGLLTLTGIDFDVQTTIAGLQGLNAQPAIVSNLDVNHGFTDFLLITVTTTLDNPSNLTISMGDVAFGLTFNGQTIGTADISGLKVVPGVANYSTDVHYQPQAGEATSAGQLLLENFLQGVTSSTIISGTSDTTGVASLVQALEQIKLQANIPALHQNLITATVITFPTDIVQTGIASATVALANPFTASINLLTVTANATFENLTLGTVDHADFQSNPIHADGHSNITSPTLPLHFNLNPSVIIDLITTRASQKGVDLGPLTALFQAVTSNPNFHPPINSSVDPNPPTCVSGKQFDVDDAILNSLAGLEVTLKTDAVLKLDDFETELVFSQFNVPAITDKTALFLIGAVAPPIVQDLVNQASLSFDTVNITNVTNDGFDVSLHGQLTGTGPLDALITFVEPVTVNWQGHDIATIALPPVCAAANVGVPDYQTFTQFATFLLHNEEFTWTISTSQLRVNALGTNFDGVSLSKDLNFAAFNGLPGVTISNFNLPGDDPAGGITISTDSLIPSKSQLGIELGTVSFNSFFQGATVGPLTSSNSLFLAADATTSTHLTGRIVPQSGNDLNIIGNLFTNFLAGKNQTLQVQGNTVDPNGNGETVNWLSTAFKTLTLNVTLPGKIFKIIDAITIEDLEVNLVQSSEDFKPLTSSKTTVATFTNPFGFSLQVIQAAQDITIDFNGADTAQLNLPPIKTTSGVSTGNPATLLLNFENQTLQSLDNDAFGAFFAQVTDQKSADIVLKGTADIVGRTSIGDVPISDIPFNVDSSIPGINSFGGTATLSNVSITGSGGNGGNQFIITPLTTTLNNPSNISLTTVDVSLPVMFEGVELGRAVIDSFNLVPGDNVIPAEFHYMPANPNDTTAQAFLTQFLTGTDDIPLTIQGDSGSSPFGSLQPALEGAKLETSLKGMGDIIILDTNVLISLESLEDNLVSVNFDVMNPTDADLVIQFVQADGIVDGTIFAHFDQAFDNFIVPKHGTANSGTFGNVLLPQGALNSLGIIPGGVLNISAAQTVLVGENGYQIPWLKINQANVPTTFTLDLGDIVDVPV